MDIQNASTGDITQDFTSAVARLASDNFSFARVMKKYNAMDYFTFLEGNQMWKLGTDTTFRWYEEGRLTQTATVAAFSGGAGIGDTANLTLPAADHFNSGTRSPFNANNILKLGDTYVLVESKNTTTPNAHILLVKQVPAPNQAAAALASLISVGDTITYIGTAYGEQTGYDEGMKTVPELREETAGIVKEKDTISGTQAGNKNKVGGAYTGNASDIVEMYAKSLIKHKISLNRLTLFGPGGTTTDADGKTVQVVKGLEHQIKERGNTYNFPVTWTYPNLQDLTRILKKEEGAMDNYMNMGHELHLKNQDLVADSLRDGAKVYMNNTTSGKKFVDYAVDAFQLGGFNFFVSSFEDMNEKTLGYAAGQDYVNDAFVLPVDIVKDAKTGAKGFTVCLGYKAVVGTERTPSFDRKYKVVVGGDGYDSETDELNFRYLTEFTPVLTAAEKAIYVSKA